MLYHEKLACRKRRFFEQPTFDEIIYAQQDKKNMSGISDRSQPVEKKLLHMPGNHDMLVTEEALKRDFPGIIFSGSAVPVSNVSNTVDRGFLPIGRFGADERFGKRKDSRRLVDPAHRRQIAVVTDMRI